jgi:NAD-dependent dihydropyrimidine dehydrogenase PreA subunit
VSGFDRYVRNSGELALDAGKCIGCGICLAVCPHAVFRLDGKKAAVERGEACMECGACARNCPVSAISVPSGVGCATAIIYGLLRGGEPSCDCGPDGSCCT